MVEMSLHLIQLNVPFPNVMVKFTTTHKSFLFLFSCMEWATPLVVCFAASCKMTWLVTFEISLQMDPIHLHSVEVVPMDLFSNVTIPQECSPVIATNAFQLISGFCGATKVF